MGGYALKLRPRQEELRDIVVEKLKENSFFLLVGEMRLGKTFVALAAAESLTCKKVLVTCPLQVVPLWEENLEALGIEGMVTPYSFLSRRTVRKEKEKLFDLAIFDEVHELRSFSSRTKACEKLARMSKMCLGLTGTPLNRSELEYYYILRILGGVDAPVFPVPSSKETWLTEWGQVKNPHSKYPTWELRIGARAQFHHLLAKVSHFERNMLIRVPKTRLLHYTLSGRQKKYIRELEKGHKEVAGVRFTRVPADIGVIQVRSKIEQVQSGFLLSYRNVARFASDKWTQLKYHLDEGKLTIIWYRFLEERDKLREMYPTAVPWKRAGDEERLGTETNILLCHTRSAGSGIEIGQADVAYYTGFFPDYVNLKQSSYRLVGQDGQKEKINYILMSNGKVDKIRLETLRQKEALFQQGYGPL